MANWLVIAAVCDCPHVAVSVMDHWTPGSEGADPGELTATGPDWRPLVRDLAVRLHRDTGLPISGMCTFVYVRDREQQAALCNDVTELVYALADERNIPA